MNRTQILIIFILILIVAFNIAIFTEVRKPNNTSDYGVRLNTETIYPPLEQIEVID